MVQRGIHIFVNVKKENLKRLLTELPALHELNNIAARRRCLGTNIGTV